MSHMCHPGHPDGTRDVMLTSDSDWKAAMRVIEGLGDQPTQRFDIEVDARGRMGSRTFTRE
jgi:hypothetical protein